MTAADASPLVRFRAARPDEAGALTDVAREAKARHGYPPAWLALWRDELAVTPAEIEDWRFEVAEVDGEMAGFCAVALGPEEAEIEHLWVRERFAGRGIGGALARRALVACARAGHARARVVSDPNARGFYEKLGGTRIGWKESEPAPRRLPVMEVPTGGG